MRITDIRVECYSAPLPTPISNGRYTYATSDRCLVRVETDEGVTGIGLGDGGVGLAGAARMIQGTIESLRPWLVGEDPIDVERLWDGMWVPKLIGPPRLHDARRSAPIDIALWDMRGQVFGRAGGDAARRLPRVAAHLRRRRLLRREGRRARSSLAR